MLHTRRRAAFLVVLLDMAASKPTLPYEFTYVRIPVHDSEPLELLTATAATHGDILSEMLKERFAGGTLGNLDGLAAEFGEAALNEKMEALKFHASKGTVEMFALVRASKETLPVANAATFLYLDEMGALKSKPVNRRAGELAAACGLDVESPFLGDIYVGRCCIDPLIHSVSVALAELEAGSPFLAQAPSENVMYAAAMKELESAKEAKQPSGGDGTGGTNAAAGYAWTQTAEDVEITISLPSGVTKTDIKVVIAAAFLRVTLAGGEGGWHIRLFKPIRPDETTWTVDKGSLVISAEKHEALSWASLEVRDSGVVT